MSTRATRRAIFGIAALAGMPLRAWGAAAPDLTARYERLVDVYNALPVDTPDDLDEALYGDICRLDDEIAHRPCRTGEEARAKVAHAIRGLLDGERGTEVDALHQGHDVPGGVLVREPYVPPSPIEVAELPPASFTSS